jgi:hypothetical protein
MDTPKESNAMRDETEFLLKPIATIVKAARGQKYAHSKKKEGH